MSIDYMTLILTQGLTLIGALIYFAYRWGQITAVLDSIEKRLCRLEKLLEKRG